MKLAVAAVLLAAAAACTSLTLPPPAELRARPQCHAWIESASGGTVYAALVEQDKAFRIDSFKEEVTHWANGAQIVTSQLMPVRVAEYISPDQVNLTNEVGRTFETLLLQGDQTTRLGSDIIGYSSVCSQRDAALAVAAVYQISHPTRSRESR